MKVGSFDPKAGASFEPDRAVVDKLLAAAASGPPAFGLGEGEVTALAPAATCTRWDGVLDQMSDTECVTLIRLFTLAENLLTGWQAGAASAVVPLAAHLKSRDAYPADLTTWIRAHSDNRFLPYGSLMDRL